MSSDRYLTKLKPRYLTYKSQVHSILGNACSNCNCTENLQIDHKNSDTKRFEILQKWCKGVTQEVLKELEGCTLLCVPCHREKSRANDDYRRGRQRNQKNKAAK